jgi:hypothetical protein
MKTPVSHSLAVRRDFLKRVVLLPVAAAAGLRFGGASASAAVAPIKRVGGPHLKPGLNVYSFLDLLNANTKDPKQGVSLFGVCDFAAKQNIDAVDLTGYFFPGYPKAPEDRYLNQIKRHAHDLGLDNSAFAAVRRVIFMGRMSYSLRLQKTGATGADTQHRPASLIMIVFSVLEWLVLGIHRRQREQQGGKACEGRVHGGKTTMVWFKSGAVGGQTMVAPSFVSAEI